MYCMSVCDCLFMLDIRWSAQSVLPPLVGSSLYGVNFVGESAALCVVEKELLLH